MQELFQPSQATRKTKIACTLGPNIVSDAMLEKLLDDGVDLFSFNAATTSAADMLSTLNRLRVLANTRKLEVATMMDTAGPGTRTGALQQQTPLQLSLGEEVYMCLCYFIVAGSCIEELAVTIHPGRVRTQRNCSELNGKTSRFGERACTQTQGAHTIAHDQGHSMPKPGAIG